MFYKGQLRSMTSHEVYLWIRTGLEMQANIPSHTARLDTHDSSHKKSLLSDGIRVFLHTIVHTTILKQIVTFAGSEYSLVVLPTHERSCTQ